MDDEEEEEEEVSSDEGSNPGPDVILTAEDKGHVAAFETTLLVEQVWLNRSLVGHVPGCLAGLGQVVAFCWVSPGFSSLPQNRTVLS